MPPLAVVEIPVLGPSPARSTPPPPRHDKGKAAAIKRLPGRRDEESSTPLSIRLDQDAPRAATIIAREITDHGALYTLRIGEVEVPQVELDEILDYVSPEHLEAYESRQFVEEDEAQRVAEEAEMHARLAKLERMRERTKTKGVLVRGGGGLDDVEASADGEVSTVERGKHGRARPSYKAQFRVLKVRRRRKRHPVTGELMPLSDEDGDGDLAAWESSEDDGRRRGA
ncbi:Voltage gated chloride channel, partial [Teratosphaeria destructans]